MAYGVINVEQMTTQSGYTLGAGNASSFKNRIINGAMVIDQRNAGASVTIPSADIGYITDRWAAVEQTDGVMTGQQSSTAPTGFTNSLKITTTTADAALGATQFAYLLQRIEGYNIADLGWGTASAATVTLSFWVQSSLTGTFGGSFLNSASNRSYPFTYTISTANTWEQKFVTVAGDTSGTWLTTSGVGVGVIFGLGVGSTYSGTAGAWAGSLNFSATGATSVVGTLNATWYVTGVQLEVGTVATSFDYRSYGTELALCQRYYFKFNATTSNTSYGVAACFSTTVATGTTFFPVTMRTSPTALEQSGTASDYRLLNSAGSGSACTAVPTFNSASTNTANTQFTTSAVLVAGNATTLTTQSLSSFLAWSAEL